MGINHGTLRIKWEADTVEKMKEVSSDLAVINNAESTTTETVNKRNNDSIDNKIEEEPLLKKLKTNTDKKDKCFTEPHRLNQKGERHNLKMCSWTVEGINEIINNGGMQFLIEEHADIIALQETRWERGPIPREAVLPNYFCYRTDSKTPKSGGMFLYSKKMPLHIKFGFQNSTRDDEERLITAEYSDFYLVNVSVPFVGINLQQKEERLKWNEKFKSFVTSLDVKKPVIICGNMNVAMKKIDVENPTDVCMNYAGCTVLEQKGMRELLAAGFVDTFRALYPTKVQYTYWPDVNDARTGNIGWRFDYFLVSKRIMKGVCDNVVRSTVCGSQHCPILLYANFSKDPWVTVRLEALNQNINMKIEPTDTVEQVKLHVQYICGLTVALQRIVYKDNELENEKTLGEYNIVDGDELYIINCPFRDSFHDDITRWGGDSE